MSDSSDGEVPKGWTVVNEDGHAQDSDSSSSSSSCDVALQEDVVHFRHMPRRSSSIRIKSPSTSRSNSVSSNTPTGLTSSPDGLKPRSPAGASSLPANFRAHQPEKDSLVFSRQEQLNECDYEASTGNNNSPNAWPQGARPKLYNQPKEQPSESTSTREPLAESNNPIVPLPAPSHLVTTQQEGDFVEEDDIDEEEDEFAAEASDGKADNTSMSSIEILSTQSSDEWFGSVEASEKGDGAPYRSMQPLITSGALSLNTDHPCNNPTEMQATNRQSTSGSDSDFVRVDPDDPAIAQEAESVELMRAPCTAPRLPNGNDDGHDAEYVEAAAASPLVEEDRLPWRSESFCSTAPLSASSYSLPSDIPPVDLTRSSLGWKDIGHEQYLPRYQDFPEDEDGDIDDSLGPPGRLAGDALRRRHFARRLRREMSMSVSSSASDLSSFSFLGLRRQSSRPSINRQHSDDVSEISSIFTDGSDDLPANMMVGTTKPGPKQYKHMRAERLNNTLNYVVLLVLASVCALGVGHYIGSYQEKHYMHTIRTGQVKRLRELQDDLVTCLDKRTTQTDDKKTFTEMVRTLLGDDVKQDDVVSDLDDEVGDTNNVDNTGDVNMNCSLCSDAKYRYSELCNTLCVQGGFWAELDDAIADLKMLESEVERDIDKIGDGVAGNLQVDEKKLSAETNKVFDGLQVPGDNDVVEMTVSDECNGETSSENAKAVNSGPAGFWATLDETLYDMAPLPKPDEIGVSVSDEFVDDILAENAETDNNGGFGTEVDEVSYGTIPVVKNNIEIELTVSDKLMENAKTVDRGGFWAELDNAIYDTIPVPKNDEIEATVSNKLVDEPFSSQSVNKEPIYLDSINQAEKELNTYEEESYSNNEKSTFQYDDTNIPSGKEQTYSYEEAIKLEEKFKRKEDKLEEEEFGFIVQKVIVMPQTSEEAVIDRVDVQNDDDDDDWIHIEVEDDYEEIGLDPKNNDQSETIHPKEEQDDMFVNQNIILPEGPEKLNATAFILKEFKEEIAAKSKLRDLEEHIETAQNNSDMGQRNDYDDDWIHIEVEDDNEEIDLDPNKNDQSETTYPKEKQDDIIPKEQEQLNATAFILKEFKEEIAAKSRLEELEEQHETVQERADIWQRKFVGDLHHKPHPDVVIINSVQDYQETKAAKDFISHKKIEDLEKQLLWAKTQANMWQSRYLGKSQTARPAEKVEKEDEKSDEELRSAPQQDKHMPAFEQEKTETSSKDSSEKTNKDGCGPLGCFNTFENILADFLNSIEGKEFLRFANLTQVLKNASFWEELTMASNISAYAISSAVYQSWVEFQQYVKSAQANNFISNFKAVLARAGKSVVTAFGTVKNYSTTVLDPQMNSTLSRMGETAQSAWDNMRTFTSDTIDQHTQSAQNAFDKVKNMSADSKVSEKVQHVWNTMRNFSEDTFQGQNLSLSSLKEKVAAAWSSVRNISAQVVSNDTKKTLSDVVGQVTETVNGIGQTVQETWKPVKHFIGDWHRNIRLRKECNRHGSHKKTTEDNVGKTDEDDPSQVKRSRKHTRTDSLHADEPHPKVKNKGKKGARNINERGCKGKKGTGNTDGESKHQKNFGHDNIKGKKDMHHQQKDERQNQSNKRKHNKREYKHNHRKNRNNRMNNQKPSGHSDQWNIDWDDLFDVFNMNCYNDADCLSHQRQDGARLYDELKGYKKWLKSHHRKRELKEVRKFLKVLEEFLSEPVLDDEHLEDLKEKFEDVLENVGRFVQDQHERSGQESTVEGTVEELEENSTVILDLELLKNEKTDESSHSVPERRKFAGHGYQIDVDDDNWFLRRAKDREEQHREGEGDHRDSNWYLHWMQGRTDRRTGVTVWDMYRWITERYSHRDDMRHHEDINWFLKKP